MPSEEIHKSASRLLIEYCYAAYRDEAETWRDLERKAQGTAAISGVFVAAVFLLLREYDRLTPVEGLLLGVVLLLLALAIYLCIRALKVTEVHVPDAISQVRDEVLEVVGAPNDVAAKHRIRQFVFDRAEAWDQARTRYGDVNDQKATAIERAQGVLLASVALVVLVGMLRAVAALLYSAA